MSQNETMTESGKATWVRYQVLVVGWTLALLIYAQRQAFIRAVPTMQNDLHLTTEQTTLWTSAFLIAYGLFQVPCGSIGDRLGARHLLTILVIGWSLTTGLPAIAALLPASVGGQFALILVVRFLFGAFQAGGFPVWARVVNDWMPLSQRGTAHGTVWMCSRLGGAISPYLYFYLYDQFKTWTTPLWIIAGLGLVWCALFWPWFRNRPSEMRAVNAAELAIIDAGRAAAVQVGPVPWSTLYTSVNIWALSLMYGFVGFSGNFITGLLPNYLKNYRQFSEEVTNQITAMPLFAGVISCVLGGFLADLVSRRIGRKWGRRIVPGIGLTCAGLAAMVVPYVDSVLLLTFLFSAWFFCNDLMMGPAWASCADVGERYSGTVSGTMNMIGQFMGAAGVWYCGKMLQQNQQHTLFFVLGCSYVMAALCWLAVDVTRPLIRKGQA